MPLVCAVLPAPSHMPLHRLPAPFTDTVFLLVFSCLPPSCRPLYSRLSSNLGSLLGQRARLPSWAPVPSSSPTSFLQYYFTSTPSLYILLSTRRFVVVSLPRRRSVLLVLQPFLTALHLTTLSSTSSHRSTTGSLP